VNLPRGGAGAQIWFTEIAARACTDYGGRLVENGAVGQAERAAWLLDTLMRNRRPAHVFYDVFLLADHRRSSCSSEHEDDALYLPGTGTGTGTGATASGPDVPRPAAGYIWDGRAGEPPGVCSEPLAFETRPAAGPRAIAWSTAGEAAQPPLTVLTDGCGRPAPDARARAEGQPRRGAVEDRVVSAIGEGLLVLLGIAREDDAQVADRLAEKVQALRVFEDGDGRMNEALGDREILCVSQFTLYGTPGGEPPELRRGCPIRARGAVI